MSKLMSLISAQVKAIIFDLDDTLYDCSGTLVLKSKELAAKTISKSIKCSEAEALKLQLELEGRLGPKADIAREIASSYNLPEEFCAEVSKAINDLNVEGTVLFPDTMNSINELKRLGYKLFLVTFGTREMQKKKIKVLGLEKAFDEIVMHGEDWEKLREGMFAQQQAGPGAQGGQPQQGQPQQGQQIPPEAEAAIQEAIAQGVPPEKAQAMVLEKLGLG